MSQRPNRQRPSPRRVAVKKKEGPPQDPPAPPPAEHPSGARVEWLDPAAIHWPEHRITSEYDLERIEELARSLAVSQEDPLIVRQLEDGTYEGAGGFNRCLVALEKQMDRVLCIVRPGDHRDVVRANLRTGLNQSRPAPLSEVEGIAYAFHDVGLSIEEIMADSGKRQEWIEDRLAVHQASPSVKEALGDGMILMGHAVLLARLKDPAAQVEALQVVLTNGWNVQRLNDYLRGLDQPNGSPANPAPSRGASRKPPLQCNFCGAEQDQANVQILYVCTGCSGSLGPNPRIVRDGEVAVPAHLLEEAAAILAGSQAGAPLAERFEAAIAKEGVSIAAGGRP